LLIFSTILHHGADLYTELEQGQLSFLTKNNFFPPLASNLDPNSDSCRLSEVSEEHDSMEERATADHKLLTPNKEVRHVSITMRVLYFGLLHHQGTLSNNGLYRIVKGFYPPIVIIIITISLTNS
jgi:hypothetical protein